MKKLFYLGLVALLLSSCAKPADDGMTTVRIGHRYMESGSMYRNTRYLGSDIEEALASIMPTTIPLTLKKDESTAFNCASGVEIALPYDCEYAVMGASVQAKTFIREAWASPEPLVEICDTIEVIYGIKTYTVDAVISSFAIVWNNKIVEAATYFDADGEEKKLPSYSHGDTSICCVTGLLGDVPLVVRLNTWDNQPWEPRTFEITTSANGNGIYCEAGRWYGLCPYAITAEIGTISLNCSWMAGGNYY